ncbi:MAG: hypothetical protein HYU78_09235 [Rhodocyclales bacterium]|nr:hypothetical protein [Rhodocyclales bacterium]
MSGFRASRRGNAERFPLSRAAQGAQRRTKNSADGRKSPPAGLFRLAPRRWHTPCDLSLRRYLNLAACV